MASQLCHPAAITIHHFGLSQGGQLYRVMEYLRGRSLAQGLRQVVPMSPQRVMNILTRVLDAVAEAHAAAVVHRDLKPDNIFLARDGLGRAHIKVLDFGLACSHGPRPEAWSPGRQCTYRRRWHAATTRGLPPTSTRLGVTAYKLLSGEVPYQASNPLATLTVHLHEPVPEVTITPSAVPAAVSRAVQTLTAKMVEDRCEDADSAIAVGMVGHKPLPKRPGLGAVLWLSGLCGALVGVVA